jgi:hypothetical protein
MWPDGRRIEPLRAPQTAPDDVPRLTAPLELKKDRAPKSPIPLVPNHGRWLAEPVSRFIHPCGIGVDLSGPGLLGLVSIQKSPCHSTSTG